MSALHEAARRVVTAWVSTRPAWVQECNEAVLALDAALESAPQPQQAEPVCKCDLRTRLVGDGCEVCNPKLAAELAQQAEPARAWMDPATGDVISDARHEAWERDFGLAGKGKAALFTVPLYTAPPQRPPLTDEEMDRLWHDHGAGIDDERFSRIARAVERKVRGEA